jgi:Holliday junction resolvase RusA-like endonuclease
MSTTTPRLRAVAYGTPAPQGSKRANPIYRGSARNGTRRFTGRVTLTEMSKKVAPWREAVCEAAGDAIRAQESRQAALGPWEPLQGPVEVRITFAMHRPKTVRRPWPCVSPDLDKLVRSTLDGLSMAGVWKDDALAVRLIVEELYVGTPGVLEAPGAVIELHDLTGCQVIPTATRTDLQELSLT